MGSEMCIRDRDLIDEIVDLLAEDENIAKLYDLWYEKKYETLRTYTSEMPPKIPLSQNKEFKSIEISPAAVDPDDVEMLQDMVCAAVNEALRGVDQMGSARMSSVTGGLNIPGMR